MCYDRNPAYIRKIILSVGKINNQHHAFNAKFNISKVIQNCSLKVLKHSVFITRNITNFLFQKQAFLLEEFMDNMCKILKGLLAIVFASIQLSSLCVGIVFN